MSIDPALPPFEVEIVRRGGASIVRVSGEFDLTAARHLTERLREIGPSLAREIILDLRETTFIDSSGIGAIVQLWNESRQDGFDFSVLPGDGQVRELLDLTGLTGSLPIIEGMPGGNGTAFEET